MLRNCHEASTELVLTPEDNHWFPLEPQMQRLTLNLMLMLMLVAGLPTLAQVPAAVVQPAAVQELVAFLGPYPALDSDAGKADLAIVLWYQQNRTAGEVKLALGEVKLTLGAYAPAAGRPLDVAQFPKTVALVDRLAKDIKVQTDALKKHFGRPRPYMADARVQPAIEREISPSYPSGHSTRGLAIAMVLAELVPQRREALLEQGRQVGVHRVVGGVHYPSDVTSGQRLGARLGEAWLAEPSNRLLLEAVRAAEWTAVPKN